MRASVPDIAPHGSAGCGNGSLRLSPMIVCKAAFNPSFAGSVVLWGFAVAIGLQVMVSRQVFASGQPRSEVCDFPSWEVCNRIYSRSAQP
jgi:hypothetical protein